MRELYLRFRGFLIKMVVFLSPTIAIIYYTYKSTSEDEYHNSPLTIQDPGHRRIRVYDRLVLCTSYVVGIFIFLLNANVFDVKVWQAEQNLEQQLITMIIFPQITGGWTTFIIWSAFFIFLNFYDVRRSKIIRDTNERLGVW